MNEHLDGANEIGLAMTNVDEIVEALRSARRRLAYAQEQLARHQRSEPSDHYALIRHQHAERSLRDDIAIAESDITVLSVELTRAAQGEADAA